MRPGAWWLAGAGSLQRGLLCHEYTFGFNSLLLVEPVPAKLVVAGCSDWYRILYPQGLSWLPCGVSGRYPDGGVDENPALDTNNSFSKTCYPIGMAGELSTRTILNVAWF
jgi:hypothetical protein